MNRGELWTAAGGSEFLSKPRPALIVQDDLYQSLGSVIVCPLTTVVAVEARFRVIVDANADNGLEFQSAIMVDKTVALSRSRLGEHIGRLHPSDMARVQGAIATFLRL